MATSENPLEPLPQSDERPQPSRRRDTRASARELPWIGMKLYSHNPFYVISAWLVFSGLRMSFAAESNSFAAGALLTSLALYTLLLAVSAWVLIRYGQVWDDVRSLLVLIVLMFLGISTCFDEMLVANWQRGAWFCVGGLAFAVLLSEALLRGIRLELRAGYRLPYFAILALFFLYPVGAGRLAGDPNDPRLLWTLFGFSPLAGLLFLTLLPAIRRGQAYVEGNGSPWPWPRYPMVLFGVLAVGVLGRVGYLCISFHFVPETVTICRPYFYVPFLLALLVVTLEIGLVLRSAATLAYALGGALVPLLLACMSSSALQVDDQGFFELFQTTLGATPLFLTLVAVASYYFYAAWRRVAGAIEWLTLSVALASVVGPTTAAADSLTDPRPLPLLIAAGIQCLLALPTRDSRRWFVAAVLASGAVVLDWDGATLMFGYGAVLFHLLLVAVLIIGAFCGDLFAQLLRGLGAVMLLGTGLAAVTSDVVRWPAPWLEYAYPALVIAVAVAYGWAMASRLYWIAAAGVTAGWSVYGAWPFYRYLRRLLPGIDYIAWGLVFFLAGMLISLTKAGIVGQWLRRRKTLPVAAAQPTVQPSEGH